MTLKRQFDEKNITMDVYHQDGKKTKLAHDFTHIRSATFNLRLELIKRKFSHIRSHFHRNVKYLEGFLFFDTTLPLRILVPLCGNR